MATAWVALGSNLDDPAARVVAALAELDELPETSVTARSSLYQTRPWGVTDQPDFINAVASVRTGLEPRQLLDALLAIEAGQGRRRDKQQRWGPRRLDLDLLLYDELTMDTDGLTLPHPGMHERAFVLVPLLEVNPELSVPGRGSVAALLAAVGTGGIVQLPGEAASTRTR
jgi:2-amino-4-hydroxy-6-hydroxymethyldihydropteridine diphosphokinase